MTTLKFLVSWATGASLFGDDCRSGAVIEAIGALPEAASDAEAFDKVAQVERFSFDDYEGSRAQQDSISAPKSVRRISGPVYYKSSVASFVSCASLRFPETDACALLGGQ